jgi:hypothetical protein
VAGFDNANLSLSTRILEIMPELADNLQGINSQVMHQSRIQDSELDTMTRAIAEMRREIVETRRDVAETRQEIVKTQQTLEHWSSGGFTFELKMTPTRSGQPAATAVIPILPQTTPTSLYRRRRRRRQQRCKRRYHLLQMHRIPSLYSIPLYNLKSSLPCTA